MQRHTPRNVPLAGTTVTMRSPMAVWILGFVTLGIYTAIWTYQVTRELRDYSRAVTRPFAASPIVAAILAALWPFAFIPGMIGAFAMGRRVRRVQDWVESPGRVLAILAALLFPLLFLHSLYLQRALNEAWARAEQGHGPSLDEAVASGRAPDLAARTRGDAERRGLGTR
jgi:hypothetical protein